MRLPEPSEDQDFFSGPYVRTQFRVHRYRDDDHDGYRNAATIFSPQGSPAHAILISCLDWNPVTEELMPDEGQIDQLMEKPEESYVTVVTLDQMELLIDRVGSVIGQCQENHDLMEGLLITMKTMGDQFIDGGVDWHTIHEAKYEGPVSLLITASMVHCE